MVVGDLTAYRKYIVPGLIGLAIVLRIAMAYHYFDISGDKIYQVAAAKNIVEGKGYTVPVAEASDLNNTVQKPMILWPPGYSVLLAPILLITDDPGLASFLLESIINVIFILLIYQVCVVLNFPFWLSLLVVLFKATEINDVVMSSTPTDYMALNLWLGVVLAALSIIKTGRVFPILLFIVLNAITPWIRYASIPIAAILPATILLYGVIRKHNKFINTGLISGAAAVLSIGSLLLYNKFRSGEIFYVLETTKGFYPENLLQLPPISFMSLLNVNFLLTQLSLRYGIYYGDLNNVLKVLSILLLAVLIWYGIKKSSLKDLSNGTSLFFIFMVAISLGTLASLAGLSVTRSRTYQLDLYWTYIEDNRYLLIVTYTLMFYLIYEFLVNRKKKLISFLLIFIMLGETAHGLWIISKRSDLHADSLVLLSESPETKKLIASAFETARKANSELILIDENYNLRGYGILKKIKIIDDPTETRKLNYSSSKGKTLLFRMKPGHELLYPEFMSQPGIEEIGKLEDHIVYRLTLR